MSAIENTILSIVLMIGLGYVLKRIDFLSEKDIDPFNKIVMYILMPCMIFHAIYAADLNSISNMGILPIGGMTTAGSTATGFANIKDILVHAIMPVITLLIIQVGSTTKYVRTAMLEVIRQDYIRTARAKGLKEKVVIYKHALRNGLIPIVTLIGLSIPGLFSGALITETVFVWPGIGKMGYDAIISRDYVLTIGFAVFMAVLTLFGNLLSDVLYAVVDPRIKLDKGGK